MYYKSYYGLEKHLESFDDWPNGKLLYSSWIIDKQQLIERLKTVPMQYPHYSVHDGSHSAKIVMNIEMFLGDDRIRQLTASDAWMLLKCAYSHDVGMTMSAEDLHKEFAKNKNFYKELKEKCMRTTRLQEAFEALDPLFILYKKRAEKEYWEECIFEDESTAIAMEAMKQYSLMNKGPIPIFDELSSIIEEYARPKHPQYAEKMITDEAYESNNDFIPLRLRLLVAKIAYLHGGETKDAMKTLPYRAIGVCGDHIHPRFCAYMLRVGDLLDMDNGRFNRSQMAIAGKNAASKLHEIKHNSIETFEINEREIVIKANFRTDMASMSKKNDSEDVKKMHENCNNAYVLLKKWIRLLNDELQFIANRWFDIVPEGMSGYCPQLREVEYKIDSTLVSEDETTLKYIISPQRAAELIEGTGLYNNPELVFIRELIQNSMDATKIQIYRDVRDGRYPQFMRDEAGEKEDPKWREKLKRLTPCCFFEKLANSLEQNRIDVKIDFEYAKNRQDIEAIIVTVRDYGIGITFEDLKAMQNIGNIIKPDIENEIEQMPEWSRPTGSFGIGLQSVFYVAKSFRIRSRPYSNDKQMGYRAMREMTFYSSKLGGEINVRLCGDDEASQFGYGTEVIVKIPMNNHYERELYMRRVYARNNERDGSKDVAEGEYDVFSNDKETLKEVIKKYIDDVFHGIGIKVNVILGNDKAQMTQTLKQCLDNDKDSNRRDDNGNHLSMCSMFGRFCLLLNENIVKNVEKMDRSENEHGFSAWSQEYNILIKYSKPKKTDNYRYKIFYKGIKVDDESFPTLSDYLVIPFFDTEIYMFGKSANTILEVNRSEFLQEKKGYIIRSIQNTHLCALAFLARELSINSHYCKNILRDEMLSADALAYMLIVSHYMNKNVNANDLVNKLNKYNGNLLKPLGLISKYNSAQSVYCEYAEYSVHDLQDLLEKDNLWFYNLYNSDNSKIPNGRPPDPKGDVIHYLFPDYFFQYRHFAIKEAKILTDDKKLSDIIYRIGPRTGAPLSVDINDYKDICKAIGCSLVKEGSSRIRPVFPAIGRYPYIEVYDIPNRWRRGSISGFEKDSDSNRVLRGFLCKFDSWIISPLNEAELYKLKEQYEKEKLGEKDKEKELDRVIDCYLEQSNRLLFRYVQRKRCARGCAALCNVKDDKDDYELKKFYKKWLKELLGILSCNDKTLESSNTPTSF